MATIDPRTIDHEDRTMLIGDPHLRPVGRAIAAAIVRRDGDPVDLHGTCAGAEFTDAPVAIISDVHGNLPALEAVLADIAAHGIERLWCLGDTVGYGASPVECLRLVRERCELVLAGNHDLAAVGDEGLDRFGAHARAGVRHAQAELALAPDGIELHDWLATRLTEVADARRSAGYALMHESQLAHHRMDALASSRIVAAHACPSPFDTAWSYVGVDVDPLELSLRLDVPPMIFVGHTHQQLDAGTVCNPGAVGQPRDGDPRAAWASIPRLVYGADEVPVVALHRVDYDIDRAQAQMRAARVPEINVLRLAQGR